MRMKRTCYSNLPRTPKFCQLFGPPVHMIIHSFGRVCGTYAGPPSVIVPGFFGATLVCRLEEFQEAFTRTETEGKHEAKERKCRGGERQKRRM